MSSAVIIDAVRTPIGKRNGRLSGWHPVDLAATLLSALINRTGVDPATIDDVIMGCVGQVGAQSSNIARSAILAARFPETVPGTTVDRQCGSSQQALHFGAQGIMAGAYDVVIAAGVESMSTVPMFSNTQANLADPYGPEVAARYTDYRTFECQGLVPQGVSAEIVADRWKLSRGVLDAYALRSQQRAARARDEGMFGAETIPVTARIRDTETGKVRETGELVVNDDGIRDTSRNALAALKPVFIQNGRITAGNSSQISDGAAALLIMSESRAHEIGLKALARVTHFSVTGCDPITMLTAPISATEKVLARARLEIGDIDLFEVSEAFASPVLAWQRELGADIEKVNIYGGGISLGHPLGASGARLMTTLVHALRATGGRFGLQTMCEGAGMANATIVERLL
jgi:acetyl-CoA acetyltransferase family protein